MITVGRVGPIWNVIAAAAMTAFAVLDFRKWRDETDAKKATR